jgi:hypothetical protein
MLFWRVVSNAILCAVCVRGESKMNVVFGRTLTCDRCNRSNAE